MMRNTKVGFVAAMAVAVLSGAALADAYGDYSTGFSKSIAPVQSSVLQSANSLGRASGSSATDPSASLREQLDKDLQKAQKDIEQSKKETELRGKVSGWRNDLDKIKLTRALPDILLANKLKDKERQLKDAQAFAAQLNQQTPGISPADINVNALDNACKSGVDFTQFKTLADQMGSQPGKDLKDSMQKIFSEQNKDLKAQKVESFQKVIAGLEAAADKDGQNDFQQDISKGGAPKLDDSVENRIRKLEAVGDRQKKDIKEGRKDLLKTLVDTVQKGAEIDANDERAAKIAGFFADNCEAYRKAIVDAAVSGAQQLKANCDKKVSDLGTNAHEGTMGAAYAWFSKTNPDQANRELVPALDDIGKNAHCTDVSSGLADVFGASLQAACNAVRSQTVPLAIMQGAVSAIQAVGAAQAQVGQVLQPLMGECQYAAQQHKKVKDYALNLKSQSDQQDQQANGNGQPQSGPRRKGTSSADRKGSQRNTSTASHGPTTPGR